jgi:hypothetical protein
MMTVFMAPLDPPPNAEVTGFTRSPIDKVTALPTLKI